MFAEIRKKSDFFFTLTVRVALAVALSVGILTLSSHWYEKGDKASPSIILARRALFVKMLIILELCYAFGSNFE